MSQTNTKVGGQSVEVMPLWHGGEARISLAHHGDGAVTLMRSSVADGGGSRSCPIPAEALMAVGAKLCSIALGRLASEAAQVLAEITARRA